jgi:hypothetical protein
MPAFVPISTIRSFLDPSEGPSGREHSARQILNAAFAFAKVLLGKQINPYLAKNASFGLSIEDLAWDCIAELFIRDETAKYLALTAYLESLPLNAMDDADANIAIRRFVASGVQQRMMQVYHEIDPALGKIIRNIKLSIDSLSTLERVARFGETYLVPPSIPQNTHLPDLDVSELMTMICVPLNGTQQNIPGLLSTLAKSLCLQDSWSRVVRLTDVALAIREVFASGRNLEESVDCECESLMQEEIIHVIDDSVRYVRSGLLSKYVTKGALTENEAAAFELALREILQTRFLEDKRDDSGYFDNISAVIPSLTMQDYRKHYRQYLEYAVKLGREFVGNRLRKNYQIVARHGNTK